MASIKIDLKCVVVVGGYAGSVHDDTTFKEIREIREKAEADLRRSLEVALQGWREPKVLDIESDYNITWDKVKS